jgi:hypothetical protein
MWIRHLLGFLTLIFFVVVTDTEIDDYLPLGTVVAVSATIYAWFILSSRMTANWWVFLVFLLAALYFVDLYETRSKDLTPAGLKQVEQMKLGLIGTSAFTTLFGFLIYVGEKKLEFKSEFNYLKFFLGKDTCSGTVSTASYWDALGAAFQDPPLMKLT